MAETRSVLLFLTSSHQVSDCVDKAEWSVLRFIFAFPRSLGWILIARQVPSNLRTWILLRRLTLFAAGSDDNGLFEIASILAVASG